MRALVATLLIASCSSPKSSAPAPEAVARLDGPDPWDTPAVVTGLPISSPPAPLTFTSSGVAEPIALPTPHGLVSAIPGEAIRAIAVTDDGRAAVTADHTQAARLWPTLDGKREPVIVTMRPASALALARHGEQFVIAGLDTAGQLELVVTKASGESIKRLAIDSARPFLTVHAVPDGFLALDDTRAITLVDFAGAASQPLVADAEEHVVSIATRGAFAMAMIDHGGAIHGRWIDVGPRWGAETPSLPIDGGHVAISPDGKRLAGASSNGKRIAIYDVVTGKRTKSISSEERLMPLGFSDDVLAYTDNTGSIFWSNRGVGSFGTPLAFGGSVVSVVGAALQISSPRANAFVGYRMSGPVELLTIGDHYLAADQMSIVELDARFRTTKVHELPRPNSDTQPGTWYGLRLFDERRVVANTYTGSGYAQYMIDLVTQAVTPIATKGFYFSHEPATGMIVYRTSEQFEVMKLDASGTISLPATITLPHDNTTITFFLLDPKRADGNVAAIVTYQGSIATVTALRSLKFGETDKYEVGSEREVTLPANWWESDRNFQKLLPAGWVVPRRLPSPDGKHTVELRDDERIRLRDAGGKEVWTIPSSSAQSVMWTSKGELVAFGSGMAQIDVTTGAFVARQCGWRFGRWDNQPEAASPGAGLCEAR